MALREVNLIPAEIIFKKHATRHLLLWAGSLVFLLGLIYGFYQYQLHAVLLKNRPKTTLEGMQVRLGATMAEIRMFQQEIEQLSRQDAFLKTLSTHQPFSEVLLNLSDMINAQTWLTKLTIISTPENEAVASGIQLYGYSLSNDHVGNFLNRLSAAPLFHNVALKYARETRAVSSPRDSKTLIKAIQFQIDCETPRFNSSMKVGK